MQPNALLIWQNLLFAKGRCYTSASRAHLPSLYCCSCTTSRTAVQATGAAARVSLASPPRAVPWHWAASHQAIPAGSHQSTADAVRPDHESTAPSTPHLRSSPSPADRATSFASSPCCSPTTLAPTSATPLAPQRQASFGRPPTVVEQPPLWATPPCCLKSVHLDAGVLRGHFPHCLAPPAHRISATGHMVAAVVCARRRARARASSWDPTKELGHHAGSAY
jgi:hypothetical protein